MLLKRVVRDMFRAGRAPEPAAASIEKAAAPRVSGSQRVLNVGGNSKAIPIPSHYAGWDHLLLDIDSSARPDIVCDARRLDQLEPAQFDAVYCSHNLEHYYKHDGARVLRGMLHVLKPDGFAEFRVPDLRSVMRKFVADDMELEDALYVVRGGPITVRDVIYGWGKKLEQSGEDFFAHKTGFTAASLRAALSDAGFAHAMTIVSEPQFEIRALAFKADPTQRQRELLNLPDM